MIFRRSLLFALIALTACTGYTRRELEEAERDDYQLNKGFANAARGVISPDTPRGDDAAGGNAVAFYGPRGEREQDDLTDLDGLKKEELGDVIVDLKAGVWRIDDSVFLDTRGGVVIRGKGPNKTRLELDDEQLKSIRIKGAKRIVIRDITVVGISGGGLWIENCNDVVVKNAHFAAVRYGLHLTKSIADVRSSVFAGCQTGIRTRDKSTLKIRATAFQDCWQAFKTTNSGLDIESCAVLEGRRVIKGNLDKRSRVVGNLFYGPKQELGWKGRPSLAAHNLVHFRGLKVQLGTETNKELRAVEDFPRACLWPEDLNVVAVHLALERAKQRGEKDYEQLVKDVCQQEAQSFAIASQKAVKNQDLRSARFLAKVALRYWGDRPLKDAPEELIAIAELAK